MQPLRTLALLTIATAVLSALPPAAAIPFDHWDDARDIDDVPNQVYAPALAVSQDGTTFAAWLQINMSSGYYEPAARVYTPAGGWSASKVLSKDAVDSASNVRVAADARGNAMAVWSESNGSGDSVYAAEFTRASGWAGAVEIDDETVDSCFMPDIAMDAGGNATVAFSCRDASYANALAVRRPAGGSWSSAVDLEFAPNDVDRVHAAAGSGYAVVTWIQFDSPDYNVFAAICEPTNCWQPAASLRNLSNAAYDVAAAIDGAGAFHFVWGESDGAFARIFYRTFVPAVGWSPSAPVDGLNDTDSYDPSIAVDAAGTVTVAYRAYAPESLVMAVRLVSGGSWSSAEVVTRDPSDIFSNPILAADASGAVVMVWQSSWYDSIGWVYWYSTWASRYDTLAGWSAPVKLDDRESRDSQVNHQIATGGGVVWVAWYIFDGSFNHIVGARYWVPDHVAPTLSVSAPLDGAVTTVPTVRINGTTEPGVTLTSNGIIALVAPDGSFSFLLGLAAGFNDVNVTATDAAGNPTTVAFRVNFKDPVPGLLANLSSTNAALSITRATLNETRDALIETQAHLAQAQADLLVAQGDLAGAQANVSALQADQNATQGALAAAQADLTAAQGRLTVAEANATNALQRAVAAQVAAQTLTTNLLATTTALNDTQDDLVATNLELDKTQNDLERANSNAVALSGQVAVLSVLAAVALLAALAAMALFLIQARRGGGGGGGSAGLAPQGRAAEVGAPMDDPSASARGGQIGAPKKSFAQKSASTGEVGSSEGSAGTAPGVSHKATKGAAVNGGSSSLGSETSQAEAAAGTVDQHSSD